MSEANRIQIGGEHYKQEDGGEEHWDRVDRLGLDYFQGQVTKYVERWKLKNGVQDLQKARHFLDKYIELKTPPNITPVRLDDLPAMVQDLEAGGIKVVRVGETAREKVSYFKPGEVMPTGWAQFVFEGGHAQGYLFTCRECNSHFNSPVEDNPHDHHACRAIANANAPPTGADPTGAYVNQG